MKRLGMMAVLLVGAIVGGSLLTTFGPVKDLFDSLFNRQTFVASGDVVLKRLQEQKELVAATGTFEVPVVVCNGTPKAYDLKDDADKDDRTPAQQLLESCDGLLDSKATVLVSAEVDAVINLARLGADDIAIDGTKVAVTLPAVELAEPRVDAESGLSVIGRDGSVPIIGGELPEDYQARAAGDAKAAVASVATRSGLPEMGTRSARGLFEGLLSALGFAEVEVRFTGEPAA